MSALALVLFGNGDGQASAWKKKYPIRLNGFHNLHYEYRKYNRCLQIHWDAFHGNSDHVCELNRKWNGRNGVMIKANGVE